MSFFNDKYSHVDIFTDLTYPRMAKINKFIFIHVSISDGRGMDGIQDIFSIFRCVIEQNM